MIANYAWLLFSGCLVWGVVEMMASSFAAWQIEEWGRVVAQARTEVTEDMERWA